MIPKKRVQMTLRHKEPDKIPIGEMGIDYPITEAILQKETFYRAKMKERKALWEGRRDEIVSSQKKDLVSLIKHLELDIVPVFLTYSADVDYKPPKFINEYSWIDDKQNIWRYTPVTEDIICIKYREITEALIEELNEPWEPDSSELELIRYVINELGESHFIIARGATEGAFPSPDLLNVDLSEFLIKLKTEPNLIYRLLEAATKRAVSVIKAIAKEGVDAIQLGADYCFNLGPFISPEMFREMILPFFREHCRAIHDEGLFVLKHTDGNTWKIIDMLIEAGIDALHGIQPSAGMDLDRLKKEYGEEISFFGAVDCDILVRGTTQEVENATEYCIKHAGPGGGLVLTSSNSIQLGVGLENYLSMVKTAKEKGKYPIKKI